MQALLVVSGYLTYTSIKKTTDLALTNLVMASRKPMLLVA
jgi:hypothetical protein